MGSVALPDRQLSTVPALRASELMASKQELMNARLMRTITGGGAVSVDVFLSVGRTYTDDQEQFVTSLEASLRTRGLNPRTVGRSDFSSKAPLKRISEVLDGCHGSVVLAFERSRATHFVDRPGSPSEARSDSVRLPTVWNQIEASMSYAKGLPLLVLVESGLKDEGLLEARYDWYVQWIDLQDAALRTNEFQAVLADWVSEVEKHSSAPQAEAPAPRSARDATLRELVGALTVPQLWAALGAVITVLAAVAGVSYRLGGG